jgi:hypothetical protein
VVVSPIVIIRPICIVLASLALVLLFRWVFSSEPEYKLPPTDNAAATQPTPTQVAGARARLFKAGAATIPIAVDEKTLDEFVRAATTNDDYGLRHLISSGRVFTVPNNTDAIILDSRALTTKVLIGPVVGASAGTAFRTSGWLPHEWVLPPQ